MPDEEPTSLSHAAFIVQRDLFERDFERFLVSLATPAKTRRALALETAERLRAIGERLFRQGAM